VLGERLYSKALITCPPALPGRYKVILCVDMQHDLYLLNTSIQFISVTKSILSQKAAR